ncbi:MAG: PAS domain S-box protein, partial [Ignavibacteriales bacterium]|nr:PAS domain S-box protein [Ignavibacteriales bacterium]
EKKHDELITLMRLMSDTMPDLLWAKDLEKRFIFANKAVCEKLLQAADTAEPIGKGDLFFAQRQRDSHPEDPQWYTFGELCMDSDAITLKEMREMQFDEYGNTNGKFLYLDVHKAPLFSDEGKLIGVVGSARDITERKKTEQALRESEERHRSILNASPDVITITDLEGHVLMVSPLATEMFGCDRQEELLGHLVTDFLVPEDRERAMSNVALMFQGVMTGPSGYRGLRKDGKKLDMDVNGEFIRSMDGQPTHMVFVLRDITERKQAEEALSRSRERFRLLHEHAPIGILLVTVSGQILEVNPAALHILGSPSVEATKGINIVTFPLLVEAGISAAFQRCVETAQAGFGEYPYVSKWGKPIHMQLRYVPILGDHGSVSLVHVIIEDTTERKRMEEELVNERSLLRNVIDNLPEPIYVKDMQGRKILANLAEAQYSGKNTVEEVLGKTDADLYPAEVAARSRIEEEEMLATGKPLLRFEGYFVTADGKQHWSIGSKLLLKDSKGIPKGILGITHDITERKRSENVLREQEEQYQALVELSPDAIAVHSDGILRFVNPAGARLLGVSSPQELIGRPIIEFVAPAHRSSVAARIHNVLTSREKLPPEDGKFLRLDGSEVDTEVISSAFNYEGKPSILALIRDSTERKRVEKALQESEGKFRTIIETSPDAIGVFDNNAIITMMNAAAAVSFGYAAPEEMVGLNALEFFMPQDREKAMGVIQNIMNGETVRNAEFKLLRKDGKSFDAEFNASALYDGKDGEPTGIIAITRDITERKRIAELLHQTHQNYETFFNTIDEFLFVLDEQGNIIHTNTTVNDRLGYSSGELLGKSVLTVHPTERREEAGRIVGEMLNGAAVFCPVPIVTKSGVQIPVETRVKLGIWDGKPAIFGVTKDISRIALSEEKFSKAFYLNPSACGLSDLDDHKYIEVNEAFYTLLGFDKDEVLGRTATELGILSPETISAIMQKADRNGKIANAEADLRSKNGDVKHVLLSSEDIHVQDKKYRFTMVYDISERKRAEEALKDSEMRFRLLAENSIEMISRHTSDGAYIYASPACRTLLGYEAEELVGHSSFEFIHPDDLACIEKSRQTVLETPKTDAVTYRLRRKDGTYIWIESTSHSLKEKESGETVEIQVSSREITRRREAEDKLRDSEARYRVLFDKAMDGIIIIGADGHIVDMNESFATMHGYHLDEMMNKSLWDISTPENAEAIEKRMEHILSGESLHFEVSHYHKDGRTFSLDAVANGVELGGKRPYRASDRLR